MTSRRDVLKAGTAGALALGFPAIVKAQAGAIKIGHLTPLTGFLGALGEYAVMGIRMATEEINAAGGVMGRKLDVMSEDSVNPATATTKAQRMLEQDRVEFLMGEINSASAQAIMQVAARNKKLFLQIGARSDVLRGKNCNKYTFHVDIPVTVMVNAAGQALLREGLIKGKRIFALTSDYLFGHDLSKAAKAFIAANGGTVVGDELTATDTTEFSLPYPVAGFNLNTADAWAAGEGNLAGIWPTVWHHELDTPGSKAFVAKFRQKHGQPPENHAWIEYVSLKIMAQAINATKGTDTEKLIAYFESQAEFDLLKSRKGYFRSWDHQLIQEAYPFTVKPKGQAKDKWDFLKFGDAVPAPSEPLESINPPKSANACVL